MAIFLGIDGGASKTSCLIGDERAVLGSGRAAGSNLVKSGESAVREALKKAIAQACDTAGVSAHDIGRVCIGVAGAARPQIGETVQRIVSEMVDGEIEVVGDMVIAHEAAFDGGEGVSVIAGTGSIAYGMNAKRETARVGGWGFAISDEGSGGWIGRTMVRALMRAYDRNELAAGRSVLLASILDCWSVRDLEELVIRANSTPPADFAGLFPVVLARSENGDAKAIDVLRRAGAELAELASIVIQRLFAEEGKIPVAMSGGVFANSHLVREAFSEGLRVVTRSVDVRSDVVEPVQGALSRARRMHIASR